MEKNLKLSFFSLGFLRTQNYNWLIFKLEMSKSFFDNLFQVKYFFFFKWKNLPLLEASSVVIGNCLDSFPPIIFIYLKNFVWPFHIFESSFSLHFFSDKIRIWIKKNSDDDCLIFFGLRRVFFFYLLFFCVLLSFVMSAVVFLAPPL